MALDRSPWPSIAIGIALVASCSGGGGGDGGPAGPVEPPPAAVTVTTAQSPPSRFIPANTRVAVGGTVTWRNTSPAPVVHNVFSQTGGFLSPDLEAEDTFEVTFSEAGDFDYQCLIHAGMTGRVTVE